MKDRLFTLIISLAVISGMVSSGLCAPLAGQVDKTACEKTHHARGDLTPSAGGKCRVTPCQARNSTVYLPPEASPRRSQPDTRTIFSIPGMVASARDAAAPDHLKARGRLLKFPSPSSPPPLFAVHCAYIC